MDDSDEEYMARAAVFAEKLLSTLKNSAGESQAASQQQPQRLPIRTSVRVPKEKEASTSKQEKETSPASSKVQATDPTVPKNSENDAKSENPVPINKTRPVLPTEVSAPHRHLVPIETDDKASKVAPEKRQEIEQEEKPPARIPRVGFTRVLLPESRSKSTNPIAIRPNIPEHHRKSFGGTESPAPINTEKRQEVELQESTLDKQKPLVERQISENRSQSLNRIPENHRKSFGGNANYQKVPIVAAEPVASKKMNEEVELKEEMPQKPLPSKIQVIESEVVSKIRSRSTNPSAQRPENSVSPNIVSKPSVPEIHTESSDQKILKKSQEFGVGTSHVATFQDFEPIVISENRLKSANPVANNESKPSIPEVQTKSFGVAVHPKTTRKSEGHDSTGIQAENRSNSAPQAESSVSTNNELRPALPEVRTKSFGVAVHQKAPRKSESAENPAPQVDISVSTNSESRPAAPQLQAKSFGVSRDLKKDIAAARSTENSVNNVPTQKVPEISTEPCDQAAPMKSDGFSARCENSVSANNVPEIHPESCDQTAPEKSDGIAVGNIMNPSENHSSNPNVRRLQVKYVKPHVEQSQVVEPEPSVILENPLTQRIVPANKASKPSAPEVQTKSIGVEHILEQPEGSSAIRPVAPQQPEVQQALSTESSLPTTENYVPNVCVQQPLMRKSRPLERRVRPILDIPTQIEPPLPPSTEPMPPFQRVIPEKQQPLRISPPASSAPVNNFSRPRAAAVTRPPITTEPIQRTIPNQQPLRVSPPITSAAVSNFSRPRAAPPTGFSRAIPRPNQNRPPPPTRPLVNRMNDEINQLCAGVTDLTIADPDFHLENRQRSRVHQPARFMPILGSSAPVQDQTTWVEEQTNHRNNRFPMNNNQYNPGESLFISSEEEGEGLNDITVEPLNLAGEYPEMFTSFRRQLAEEERNRHVAFRDTSIVDLGRNNNEPEHPPPPSPIRRSNTPLLRRPTLLPPIAKGRIPERREVLPPSSPLFGPPTNVPTTSNNMPAASSDSADSAIIKPTKEEKMKTEHLESADAKYLMNLNPDDLEKMSEEELQQVTNSFYESGPRLKFKESFPFMAEGVVQKDCETGQLKVYSQRLGRIMLEDSRWKKTEDYVYFVAIKPGVNRGLWFDIHPKCLVSAKFPSVEKLVLRGYAILAHPNGCREDSIRENRWICWNDSLGLMSVISGAARTPLKKQPVWDKQLDVVSIHANFENRRFVVAKMVALTNSREKREQFPDEVFLVQDAIFKRQCEDDLLFHSAKLNASILIKRTLVGEVHTFEQRAFELVVVPTFPRCNSLEFRSMLIIDNPQQFWKREKEWIRELLLKKTESYCN